jgi:Glyoxalase-like domain
MSVHLGEIVIDCAEPRPLAEFWGAATGYEIDEPGSDTWVSLHDPQGKDISIAFQRVPEPKVAKNRVHIDLYTSDEEQEAVRIEGLGAKRLWVSEKPEDPFIVLADPEGNEFCVCRE